MSSLKNIFLLALKNNKTGDITYKEFKKMMKGADEQTKRQYFYKNNAATNPRLIERQTSLNIPILTSLNYQNISMNPVLTLVEGKTFGGSFNEAFKLARLAGLKTFTWNGKLYGTQLAPEVSLTKKIPQNIDLNTSDSQKVLTLVTTKNTRTPSVQIGRISATPDYYGKTFEVTPHVSTIYGKKVSTPIVTSTVLLSPDDYSMYPYYYTDSGFHRFGTSDEEWLFGNESIEDEIKYPIEFEMKSPETLSDVYIRRPNVDMWGRPIENFVPGWDRITPVVGRTAKKQKGGTMNLNKFLQGGKTSSQQDAVMQFVQDIAQALQADPLQVIQDAQSNPDALKLAVQVYLETLGDIQKAAQAFSLALQLKTQAARHGTKLNYLKSLKNQCTDDEELVYYKTGGKVGCGCRKKENGGEIEKDKKDSPINSFKNKIKKHLTGTTKDGVTVNTEPTNDFSALDLVPYVGTARSIRRAYLNPTVSNIGLATLETVGDLAGLGIAGSILKTASKFNRVRKALRNAGYFNVDKGAKHFFKINPPNPSVVNGILVDTANPKVYTKTLPESSDLVNAAASLWTGSAVPARVINYGFWKSPEYKKGGKLNLDKCGGKMKKEACGGVAKFKADKCGGKMKKK